MTEMEKKLVLFQALVVLYIPSSSSLGERRMCKNRQDPLKVHHSYAWNKSQVSALDYQQSYCKMRCRGNEKVMQYTPTCWDLECIPCHCERPACEYYGICCPDISVPFECQSVPHFDAPLQRKQRLPDTSEPPAVARRRSAPVLDCDTHPHMTGNNYLFIRSCKADYDVNQTVIDLCEMDRQPHEQTIETFIKAVDLERQIVYRNKFCAQCNHVTNFTSLPTMIRTDNFTTYYKAKSRDEMLQQVLLNTVEIDVVFPDNFTLLDCLILSVPKDNCRHLPTYSLADEDIFRACETNQQGNELVVYYREENTLQYPRTFTECGCQTEVFAYKPLPFSLLLDLSSRSRMPKTVHKSGSLMQASQCSFNEWSSLNGECFPLFCGPGKEFLKGKCTASISEIKGLSYRLRLWLQPLLSDKQQMYSLVQSDRFTKKTLNSLFNKIQEMIEDLSSEFRLDVEGIRDISSPMFLKFPTIFWMECLLFALKNISRNDFEMEILNRFMTGNISVQNFANVNLLVTPFQMLQIVHVKSQTVQNTINQSKPAYLHARYKSVNFFETIEYDYININHALVCRYVRFEPGQYQIDVRNNIIPLPPSVAITIDLNSSKILITDNADLNMVDIGQDGELNVCEDLLNSKLKMFKADVLEGTNRELAGTSLAEYIVSIACSSASILCLVLTLMTYILFSELRTEAGLNNMFLSSSLLLAQVSLMITSHIFRSSTMCTVLGVVTHFMWLWMFSWSFLCSYHMFQVFTSSTRRTSSLQDLFMAWKKILFSLTCPSAIILTTVVGSFLASGGKEIGYGRFSCYLNSTLLVGLTVAGPLSLVTIINVVFFTKVVHKIHSVRKLQSITKRKEQNTEWHIYVKLSSVTGAFWTVAIVAAALNNNILQLISIVLNGLQGVAILVSFICNKRVLLLYKQMTSSNRETTTEELRVEPITSR
ncbi:adhesion G protein-coupled receptor E4P [Biomphalaria pfeifferi]|uniref:Adhesion G protein-coupled receptor E4P n=1 Tax=Biomphalaria pfeifferi TaxID=112525 RepID=A0AAD8BKC7_BIOPF|nr:adhesion G protein-coupled receptor E4P [Biomphalaria pfeifferi]